MITVVYSLGEEYSQVHFLHPIQLPEGRQNGKLHNGRPVVPYGYAVRDGKRAEVVR